MGMRQVATDLIENDLKQMLSKLGSSCTSLVIDNDGVKLHRLSHDNQLLALDKAVWLDRSWQTGYRRFL